MNKRYKIAYCTPSLYMAGGIERVLTTKANYFADVLGYDIYIILTDGKGKIPFYYLSNRVNIINLDINFEDLWNLSFISKIPIYIKKQHKYKKALTQALYEIKPDITVSLLRREINFITKIKDGSKKIGELHVNRTNYRNFESNETNLIKNWFSRIWMRQLIRNLKKLDRFVTLTEEDKKNWKELQNVVCIPNPLTNFPSKHSTLEKKKVIAVGRYCYQKGFDLLLKAWKVVVSQYPDWILDIYGSGNRDEYIKLAEELNICVNCNINGAVENINEKYADSSIFVLSSRFEGFGMVLIEAMACGLPCVSFGCPCGPKDIINDRTNGLLVENGNWNDLANKIIYLIENKDKRLEMCKHSIANSKRYKIENISLMWNNLFKSIMT